MNTITNPYDALYTNLKNRFTVIHDGTECTVGDYMLMKAGKSASKKSDLPVAKVAKEDSSIVALINYMNEKLTIKNPPVKDKTIKRFPVRTSLSAMLSAVAACALVISCGVFSIRNSNDMTAGASPDYSIFDEMPEIETTTEEAEQFSR